VRLESAAKADAEKPIKNAKRNGFTNFEPDEIQFVVQGELGYCDSLGMFEE